MAEKNNASCSICGKDYHLCLACKDSINLAPWKVHTDTAEHYKVFQIIRGFSTGVYTKDEAKAKFKNVDLSDLDSFRPHIKKIIEDILKEEKVVENIIEPIEAEAEVEIETKEVSVVEKIGVSRKRNYRMETK